MYEMTTFEIDGLTYVVEFTHGEFCMHVDGTKSKTVITEETYIEEFDFFDVSTKVTKSSELVKTKSPVKVYRACMAFIEQMIGKHKPHYFHFSANEDKKISLYEMIAKKIVKKGDYYLQNEHGSFYFYKIV